MEAENWRIYGCQIVGQSGEKDRHNGPARKDWLKEYLETHIDLNKPIQWPEEKRLSDEL